MQPISFESLISAPWPEDHENSYYCDPYHVKKNVNEPQAKSLTDNAEEGIDHVVILGYN